MGTFTVTRQAVLNLNLRTPWWLSGASIDLDFRNNRYYDSSLATGQQPLAPLSSYLSCTRASTGYAKNSAGNLVSFANNALRQTDLGLLIEDARTNLVLFNTDLSSSSYWYTSNCTLTVNATTAPDGTGTAFKFQVTSTGGTSYIGSQGSNGFTGTAGASYTISEYVKYGSGNPWVKLAIFDGSGNQINSWFNISTGVVGTSNATGDGTVESKSVEAYGNGWYRISLTGHFTASHTLLEQLSGPTNADNTESSTSGDFCYTWGAQVEQGSFASSYIPTTSASVTRAADAVPLLGVAATTLSLAAASFRVDVGQVYGGSAPIMVVRANSSSGSASFFRGDTPSAFNGVAAWNNSLDLKATFNGSALWSDTSTKRMAAGWSSAGRSICGNGGPVATDLNIVGGNITPAIADVNDGPNTVFGYIQRLALWNSRLSDSTLRALTYSQGMTDLTAWVSQVVTNGGTVSSARQGLVGTLIDGLKADGVWSKLDALWLFASENSQSALTDIVGGLLASVVNAPTFTTDRGYTGNGTNSLINTNYNPVLLVRNFTQNSAHFSAWVVTARSTGNGVVMGNDPSSTNLYLTYSGDSNIYTRVNDNVSGGALGVPGTTTGHLLANRSGASADQAYFNGSLFGSPNQTSKAVTNGIFYVLGDNSGGSNFTNSQVSMASIGGSLTATDVTNFYNRLRTYMTAVGVP